MPSIPHRRLLDIHVVENRCTEKKGRPVWKMMRGWFGAVKPDTPILKRLQRLLAPACADIVAGGGRAPARTCACIVRWARLIFVIAGLWSWPVLKTPLGNAFPGRSTLSRSRIIPGRIRLGSFEPLFVAWTAARDPARILR